jgi:hypothetical protein
MSEEEILNKITEMINELRDDINRVEDWVNTGEDEEKLETLEGILDLYNKEKEKNRILEDLLQGRLYELYLYYKKLAGSYQANSISKDKIRTKIKDLKENNNGDDYSLINVINILKDLL